MKRLILCAVGFLVLEACERLQGSLLGGAKPEYTGEVSLLAGNDSSFATCLWDKAGLRAAPGSAKNNEYITTVLLGEKVSPLNKDSMVISEKRNYIKVRLSDGKTGWVYDYLFGVNARTAALKGICPLYRRPDKMMLKTERFEPGELIFILEDQGNWLRVTNAQKEKTGWIELDKNVITGTRDVMVATLYQRALREPNLKERIDMMHAILSSESCEGSVFLGLVSTSLKQQTAQISVKNTRLRIVSSEAEILTQPLVSASNIVMELAEGDICKILQVKSGGKQKNVWYEVEYQGKQGWISSLQTDFTSEK